MSPYRVVVREHDCSLQIYQAMHSPDEATERRKIYILRRVQGELLNPTLDEKIADSYIMVDRVNSLICDSYDIVENTALPQKYACVHTSNMNDSKQYALPGRCMLISECLRSCMLDYAKKKNLTITEVI